MSDKEGYNVVFMGIGGPDSNHPGIITWTRYESQEAFEKILQDPERKNKDAIIARAVTEEEAIKLVETTSESAYIISAIAQSTFEGHVDMAILDHHLKQINLIMQFRGDPQIKLTIPKLPENL